MRRNNRREGEDAYTFIKEKVGLLQYAESIVDGEIKSDGSGRYRSRCPIHKGDNPTSFSIDSDKGLWKCFAGCGGGSVIDLYSLYNDIPVGSELLANMATEFRLTLPEKVKRETVTPERLYKALGEVAIRAAESLYDPVEGSDEDTALLYLASRFDDPKEGHVLSLPFNEVMDNSLLGFLSSSLLRELEADLGREVLEVGGVTKMRASGSSRYSPLVGMVTIPIRDSQGRVIGIAGRAIDDFVLDGKDHQGIKTLSAKYINPTNTPVYDKSDVLFEADYLESCLLDLPEEEDMSVVVVEGYFDATGLNSVFVSADRHDIAAVALCGTALTEQHGRHLADSANRVYILTDNDQGGIRSLISAAWIPYKYPHLEVYPAGLAVETDGVDGLDLAYRGIGSVDEVLDKSRELSYGPSAIRKARELHETDTAFYREIKTIYKKIGDLEGERRFLQDVSRETGIPMAVLTSGLSSATSGGRKGEIKKEGPVQLSASTGAILDFVLSLDENDRRRLAHSYFTIKGLEDTVLRRYFGVTEDFEVEAISSVIRGDIANSRRAVAAVASHIPDPEKKAPVTDIGFVIRNAINTISSEDLPKLPRGSYPIIWTITTKVKNSRGLLGRPSEQLGMFSAVLEIASAVMNVLLDDEEDYADEAFERV